MPFKKNDFNKTLHKAQAAMQKHAYAIAANNGVKLDYSEESVRSIDKILSGIAQEFKKTGLTNEDSFANDEGVRGVAEAIGCYLAECAERKNGTGEWINADPEAGEPRFGLRLPSGATIFPIDWVLKKLIDPKHYSISTIYSNYVSHE